MKKNTYLVIGGVALTLVVGALLLTYQPKAPAAPIEDIQQASAAETGEPEALHVYADGILIKNGPLLKPDTWYVGVENEGKHLAVELAFDENSICVGSTASGTCLPDIFIEERPVHIEGVVDGDAMRVLELTFIQALN